MEEKIKVGDIVLSKAGRDKERHFVVVALQDIFAFVADGDLRKIDSPKKKKLKHIKGTGAKSEYIEDKLSDNLKVTNAELRRAIFEFEEEQTV